MNRDKQEPFPYEDILFRERPVSTRHRPMPVGDRAAQFAPFAALTGYEGKIEETALLQEEEVEKQIEHIQEEEC